MERADSSGLSAGCEPSAEEPLVGNYFVSTYPPFSSWRADEVESVSRALQTPAAAAGAPPLGLYVHVPFCVERCDYCYYLSGKPGSAKEMDTYTRGLVRELELLARAPALRGRELEFAYFGGGTPSLLPAPAMERLLGELSGLTPWTQAREVTFECAPRTATRGRMAVLRRAGVNRVSMGVQQLHDGVLRANGRVHLVADVLAAYEEIRRWGFDKVNIDLIVGLVGETDETFFSSLEATMALEPDSVTIYQLEVPRGTPLYRLMAAGRTAPPASWTTKRTRLAGAFERLEAGGWSVRSAYAAARDRDRSAFVYQDSQYHGADLLGVGAASFSYLGGVHSQNEASVTRYLALLDAGELPTRRARVLTDAERCVRELVLQLKLGRADASWFRERFGVELAEEFAGRLAPLASAGWLTVDVDGVTMTRAGLLRVDHLLPALYLPEHQGIRYT